jgi:hypothetical protein
MAMMSDFNQRLVTRLHALAREHREGRLSLEAYRKLRAPLLDCLDSHPEFQSTTLPNHEMRSKEAGAPASPTGTGHRRGLVRVLALLAVCGLLAAAGLAIWWAHERATADTNRHTVSPPCNDCPA